MSNRRLKGATKHCELCDGDFLNSGFSRHYASCKKKFANLELRGVGSSTLLTATSGADDYEYDDAVLGTQRPATQVQSEIGPGYVYNPLDVYSPHASSLTPTGTVHSDRDTSALDPSFHADYSLPPDPASPGRAQAPQTLEETAEEQLHRTPQVDDIKIVPHPLNAKRKRTRYCSYESFTMELPKRKRSNVNSSTDHAPSTGDSATTTEPDDSYGPDFPWTPFNSRIDFEFAQLMQSANLNEAKVNEFIAMVLKIIAAPREFSLLDAQQVKETWRSATDRYGQGLQHVDVPATYKGEEIAFPFWRIKAWDWAKSLLQDPDLEGEFRWDAEQLFRHDGQDFERFINEPWTANRWWEIQSSLPQHDDQPAAPFCIIFYADKTKLSTMGTKKGYPVYLRCANLPAHIRNGEGLGGGRMVGLIPIVPEDNDKSGKKPFVDFKRVVWHACIAEILESLRQFTQFGYPYMCSDGIRRWLYPVILILSGDFEEQCVMAAIRGLGSGFPCPVCLASSEEMPALGNTLELRSTENMKRIYDNAEEEPTAAEREKDLKAAGLRRVENAFWSIPLSDPYAILSWDRLHAYHSGLFRKHILKEFLQILEDPATGGGAERRALSSRFEKNLQDMPRWRDLAHFSHISDFNEYCDGRKYEDLSKVIIFASHCIFPESNERGYQWLALARSYLELDMWSSLRNHTTSTIRMGRQELGRFDREAKAYTEVQPTKKWDFPKAHSHAHLFDDIENKGSTINFNTKYSEKKHKSQKQKYALTNFKDVEKQIARMTHEELAGMVIQQRIRQHDSQMEREREAEVSLSVVANLDVEDGLTATVTDPDSRDPCWVTAGSGSRILLSGAAQGVIPEYQAAFENLPAKLTLKMRADLSIRGRAWSVLKDTVVTKYQVAKAIYTSLEDSQSAADFIRANHYFHGHPRYDCALFNAGGGEYTIGRVVSILGVPDNKDVERQYALVIPFDLPVLHAADETPNLDRGANLRFKHLRSRKAGKSIVVAIEHIVRGALVVPDWGSSYRDQYIVMDVVDADFFLRMRLHGLGDLLVSDGSLK